MKIRLAPVAAGLAAATGLAITGASLASADVTSSTSPAAAYGQVAPPEGEQPTDQGGGEDCAPAGGQAPGGGAGGSAAPSTGEAA